MISAAHYLTLNGLLINFSMLKIRSAWILKPFTPVGECFETSPIVMFGAYCVTSFEDQWPSVILAFCRCTSDEVALQKDAADCGDVMHALGKTLGHWTRPGCFHLFSSVWYTVYSLCRISGTPATTGRVNGSLPRWGYGSYRMFYLFYR